MAKEIKPTNQTELDAIDVNFEGEIRIESGKFDRIDKFYPNAVIYVSGSAQIRNVSGSAQISDVSGSAQISYVYGSAQIRNVSGSAQIRNVSGSAQIRNVSGSAQISDVYGSAQISYVYGSAQIRNVSGSAQISYVYGSANVLFINENAQVTCSGKNIISKYKGCDAKIKKTKNCTVVILEVTEKFNFQWYLETFPLFTKNKEAVLYKAVHKRDNKYFSNHASSYEYKVGESYTEKVDENKNRDCSFGLHASHKMWALKFGAGWEDMALLEVSMPISKIVVPNNCDGKIRSSEMKVLREVPKEEYYK